MRVKGSHHRTLRADPISDGTLKSLTRNTRAGALVWERAPIRTSGNVGRAAFEAVDDEGTKWRMDAKMTGSIVISRTVSPYHPPLRGDQPGGTANNVEGSFLRRHRVAALGRAVFAAHPGPGPEERRYVEALHRSRGAPQL